MPTCVSKTFWEGGMKFNTNFQYFTTNRNSKRLQSHNLTTQFISNIMCINLDNVAKFGTLIFNNKHGISG